METLFTVQNLLLVVVALLQAGQWVQKQLNSDANLAEKIDALSKQVTEIKTQMKHDYVFRDVYQSEQRSTDRRVSALERRVFNGGGGGGSFHTLATGED